MAEWEISVNVWAVFKDQETITIFHSKKPAGLRVRRKTGRILTEKELQAFVKTCLGVIVLYRPTRLDRW